jgi:hypothetical protein
VLYLTIKALSARLIPMLHPDYLINVCSTKPAVLFLTIKALSARLIPVICLSI